MVFKGIQENLATNKINSQCQVSDKKQKQKTLQGMQRSRKIVNESGPRPPPKKKSI